MSKRFFSATLSIMCLVIAGVLAQGQPQRTYRGTYQSIRQLILRIENRSDAFRNNVQLWTNNNATGTYAANGDISVLAQDYDSAVRRLADRFARRQSTALDVQEVLNRADRIDTFLRQRSLDARTQSLWSSMRIDLNQLARAYNVSWQQTTSTYPPYGNQPYGNRLGSRLTGTYRIDTSRSEDARAAADRATRDLAPSERWRVRDLVTQRLQAPEQIAIDVRGRNVTMASTRAAQITFDADGRERTETNANGRIIQSRATLNADQLTVSATGDRGSDFSVTFDPVGNGRQLNVTRRVYVQGLSQPVVVQSTYDKISDVAQFNIYNPQSYPGNSTASSGFIVPDGVRVVAVLDDTLSTRNTAVGDHFTLRVTEPAEFDGATIEGHVSHVERSGRLTGRSVITLDFDSIRLRDGRAYNFAGILDGVRTPNGEIVRVDTEGTVRDSNQTTKTEQRAAIGGAVGAIIGAIAGGGKGAAIGAILGAGGGAGSVYVQGRNELDLERGTEITIRAGAPANTPR